ncbi:uncharacterized protein LOC119288143 [Triticum dicoccoides]|uniref:uncharacterized protein LOC119288143 n=1 Tax=Triticum dicoccoides TaxID=85692 RepID=UPI0018904384|nr:uncharacterized protein LOC119288143 [Triticum dicoccoides]
MQRAPPPVTSRAVWYCPDPPQVKLGTGLGQQHLSGVHTSPSSCRLSGVAYLWSHRHRRHWSVISSLFDYFVYSRGFVEHWARGRLTAWVSYARSSTCLGFGGLSGGGGCPGA